MRRSYGVSILLVVTVLALAGAAWAQGAALEGTVTLKGGKTLTGEIKVAEVGVLQGCGVGTLLPDLGFFSVKVGDQVVEVKGADLAEADVQWGLANETDTQSWEIKQITLIKRDGTSITGTPTWSVQATSVSVDAQPSVYAFPKAGADFSPDNLLSKIQIAGAMPGSVAPAAPAPTTPAPTTPATTTPAETTPAATTPAATPAPAATPPAAVVAVPVTPPPGNSSPPATAPNPAPAAPTPPATPPPAAAAPPAEATVTSVVPLGQGAFDIYITGKDGEKMIVRINVSVLPAPGP
jgi:hypothetical protein